MKKITVRLEDGMYEGLRLLSTLNKESIQSLVVRLLQAEMNAKLSKRTLLKMFSRVRVAEAAQTPSGRRALRLAARVAARGTVARAARGEGQK